MKDVLFFSYNVTILILFVSNVKGFENCTTPDRKPGECIRLNLCKPLLELLRKKPLTYNDRMFLRKSQCDYADGSPWVCCQQVQPTTQKPSPSKTTERTFEPTTSHPSILLDPGEGVCGQSIRNLDNRIFGGSQTLIGEFPWMAVLLYAKPNKRLTFGCGGALITNKHVVTAAHCVIEDLLPKNWSLKKVRLGEWDRRTDPDCQEIDDVLQCALKSIDIKISKIYSHEHYDLKDPNKHNDIAVMRLESVVKFTEFVNPICLPADKSQVTDYGSVVVIGFGKTETKNSSEQMLKAEIDIVNHSSCRTKYRSQGRMINESQICAIRSGADTCKGDSGSPLLKQSDTSPSYWFIVGITSFGPSVCANSDLYPGIYTNVASYIDWIKEKIKM